MTARINALLLLCLLSGTGILSAQNKPKPAGALTQEAALKLKSAEDTLAILAYAVVNDSIENQRFAACKVLIKQLVQTLKIENSFKYQFDRLKSISILTPPDSSFRIFSWQLFVNDSTYRYYGAIQMNQSALKLYPLIDRSADMERPPVYEQLTPERWFGSLYYNMRQFDSKEGKKYLLFGFDVPDFFSRRKVIEVLSFDKDGDPVFGAPVFKREPAKIPAEQRLFFEYAADGSIKVNWDEQYKMILFDHLIPIPSPHARGITFVTDGSYDALVLEKGVWKFVTQVFHDMQDEAPRPEPILDTRKDKDISGKPKKVPKKKGGV
jgi:hypothetical protein